MNRKREYIDFTPNQPKGYPAGKSIYYECLICGGVVESKPRYFSECECQNITVDNSGGRLAITDHEKFKIFKT
ncbi:hypothetical protein [Microbulbifer sp. JTAC008]|uniref:hypothetical protein n=1 Tax=unclassified Microbulbifer TaxID=2619833 RepID=UPI00403A67DF